MRLSNTKASPQNCELCLHQKSKQTKSLQIKKNKKIMKTTIITIAASIILALTTNAANAKSSLSYAKSCNSTIGITPLNAIGGQYQVRNAAGKIILSGKINSSNTFYISIKNLMSGSYTFSINGQELQQFEIN
jgi:hypothetical protein